MDDRFAGQSSIDANEVEITIVGFNLYRVIIHK